MLDPAENVVVAQFMFSAILPHILS